MTTANGPHVYQAICQIKKHLSNMGGITKDKQAQYGDKYKFRGIDDMYNVLCGLTADVGLCLIPRVVKSEVSFQTNHKGTLQEYVHLTMEIDLVSAVDGSKHTACTIGEGIDTGDKGTGKAQSYAYKMAHIMVFQIPTHGESLDNEAYDTQHSGQSQQAAPQQQVQQQEPPRQQRQRRQSPPAQQAGPPTQDNPQQAQANGAAHDDMPFPAGGQPVQQSQGPSLFDTIANTNTFPLLFAVAQDADKSAEPMRAQLFEAIKKRTLDLFGAAKTMKEVQEGFPLVQALGQPDDLKRAANQAYARFRGQPS